MNTATNALWVIGCAIGLATISYAHWEARTRGTKLRVILGHTRMQIMVNVAAIFFCLGLLGTASESWERVLWGMLALAFGVQVIALREVNKDD